MSALPFRYVLGNSEETLFLFDIDILFFSQNWSIFICYRKI